MKYITGLYALSIPCELETCGYLRGNTLDWNNPTIIESDDSIFSDYGIEYKLGIPNNSNKCHIANHIRAILDMLDSCDFSNLLGMRDNYINNEEYTPIILSKVGRIIKNSDKVKADKINSFMELEYNWDWQIYKQKEHLKV